VAATPPPAATPTPAAAAPAPEPAPPPPVEARPAPAPDLPEAGSAAAKAQAQRLVRQAFEALDEGAEDRARTDLQQAVVLDPDNRSAACLLRGLNVDPLATLGRDHTQYTVRPGDTLGRIAQRALGDTCEFYLLARYNQIRVPRQLAAGQVIKVPGKTPLAPVEAPAARRPAEAAPAEASRPQATPATAAPAPATAAPAPAAPPPAPAAPAPAAAETAPAKPAPGTDAAATKVAIDRHHRNAQAAFRRQDLNTAIQEWDKVLALDPNNDLARARKQEALDLQRRLKQVK
jgi:LysM repeat protein